MCIATKLNQWHRAYLKGSTLVEVLIALAIITVCMSLASMIYISIQKSSLSFFKLKAAEIAELFMMDTMKKRSFYPEEQKAEEFSVRKYVESHNLFYDCKTIRIVVFNADKKKLHELESVVYSGDQ